ncbi:glycosyltransferase family 4 protein [Aquimarina agarilytica]|uniref:glycosyltransferase family 4 protein n=1 Tax=Aquimarina agarilytica TaxID=1087449 RepID=UPI0002893F03|nr:glycosyltransferase family 4 protein [Aquimarina agarilytica]
MAKIIRVTTVPVSLGGLLKGQLKFMSNYYEILGISSEGSASINSTIYNVAEDEGIRVIPVEMTRKITPIKDLKAVYQLYKVFKKEKPDIVHSHTPKAGTLGMLAAKLAGVPNRLHTIAGLPLLVVTGPKRKLLNFVEKLTYSCATKIYPNSYGLKDIIVENKFIAEEKTKVIAKGSSNGIDTSYFDPSLYSDSEKEDLKKQLSIKQSDVVFLFVGRLVKDKGINELIEAFKKISVEFDQAKLLLVGTYEKDLDPLLPDTETEINTNSNIISVGWQNDVRPFFSIADVLTFPSYREGFPNVVMQAGAMGLPSIVTDINGCNEIVSEGINGLIIPVQSTKALYSSMKKLLIDHKLKEDLGSNSRAVIVNSYERTFVWQQLLKEYKALIN